MSGASLCCQNVGNRLQKTMENISLIEYRALFTQSLCDFYSQTPHELLHSPNIIIHTDAGGPSSYMSENGYKCIITFSDDYNRRILVTHFGMNYLLNYKTPLILLYLKQTRNYVQFAQIMDWNIAI